MGKPLSELLEEFNKVPDEDFDPEKHIGEIKDKIDGIEWRIDKWKADAAAEKARATEMYKRWVKPYEDLVAKYLKNIKNLESWVLNQMLLHDWEELPGHTRRVQIMDSTPSVDVPRPATAMEYLRYPKYVAQDISYSWVKAAIKNDEAEDGKLPVDGATIKHGKHIRFYNLKGK